MPTYIYQREDGTRFELRQSMKDDALTECPDTGQQVRRVITGGRDVQYPMFDQAFTSNRLKHKRKLIKALEKNPLHTTMSDKDTHIRSSTKARSEKVQEYAAQRGMKYERRDISIKDAPVNVNAIKQVQNSD